MSLKSLDVVEKQIVFECLAAACHGPFFPNWEFSTLFGLSREQVCKIAAAAPNIDDSEPHVALAISNSFVNLLGYPHGQTSYWSEFISVSEDDVRGVFEKWKRN